MKNLKSGFTLIELIFVVVVLGILAAVAIPKLTNVTTSAKTAKFKAQVKEIQKGIKAYANAEASFNGSVSDNIYPDSINKDGNMFGLVLSNADTSNWEQDTINGNKDWAYTYEIQGYGKFWCAYYSPKSSEHTVYFKKFLPVLKDEWEIGDFECFQFKNSKGQLQNNEIKTIFQQ